MKLFEADQEQR